MCVCMCVFGETRVCMWRERWVFVCMWRDGRCVETGVFVGVFVEKQEVSGGRDRGVSECDVSCGIFIYSFYYVELVSF